MKIILYIFTGFTFLLSIFFLFITVKSNNQKFATNTLFSLLLCVLSVMVAVFVPGITDRVPSPKLEIVDIKEPHFELITNYDSIDNYKVYCVRTNQTDPQLLGKYARYRYFSYSSKVLVYFFDETTDNVYIDEDNNHNPWLSFLDDETKKHLIGTYELEKEDDEYWYDKDDATKDQKRRKKLIINGEYEEPTEENAEDTDVTENNEETD